MNERHSSDGLRLNGLGIHHAGERILDDVSLDIRPGESLCLIGASGGGKSLIAAAIAGLLPVCMQVHGDVRLGREVRQASDQTGLRTLWDRHLCLLPQEPLEALAPLTRADDQVRLSPRTLSRSAAREWLARFGLNAAAARRLPAQLSGGMAQRLLSALVSRSRAGVLVLDEPTKGLDPARRAGVIAMLLALREAGRALLVITHDLDVVRGLGGRVAVLEGRAIVESGESKRLFEAPSSRFLRDCLAAEPLNWPILHRSTGGSTVAGADALVVARGKRRLTKPMTLELKQGQVTALLGDSGVGKTSLADTLLGLAPAASGRVLWFGQQLDRSTRRHLRPRFQKLHQDPTTVFPANRTFAETMADLASLDGGKAAIARASGLMEELGVPAALLSRRPAAVSGGEAQRIALARLLALEPALLVADEPSSRLDLPRQAEMLRLLRRFAEESELSVLLITHSQTAADALSDQQIIL